MDRLTIRFDNTFRPIQKLDINGFVVYTHTNTQTSNVLFSFPNGGGLSPYSKLLDENNNPAAVTTTSQSIRSAYRDTASYPALLDWSYRPLDELKNADNTAQLNDIRLGAGLKYYLINGLNVEVKYQYQRSLDQTRNYYSQKTYRTRDLINSFMQGTPDNPIYAVPLGGILDLTRVTLASWNLRTQINYTKQIGQHNINALAGTEVRETVTGTTANREYGYSPENNLTTVVNYATDYTKRPDRSNQRIPYENSISGEVSRYRSYYANLSYIFREKYSLTASGRIDGSNFYGVKSNQRIVPLWSAGVGYEISKAPFYKLSWLPYLKVTMTYGFNGNTNNTAAAYTLLGYQRNGYINVNSAYLLSPANPRLQWETINMINARINFATKNARLNGSLEYYRKKSANLIAPISTFPSSGVTSFSGNNAGLKGSGIDITLNSINISSAAWRWETNFLFSTTKDEVTSYQIQPSLVADYLSNSNIPVIGKPLYKIYSYRWAGLDPTTGASRAYLDGNIAPAANVVSEATLSDIVYGGRTTHNIVGSFRNTLERYRLSLSFNITYKFGYVFRRTSVSYQNMVTSWGGHADYSKRWQKPGDENVTDVPALSFPLNSNNDVVYSQSNILVERGDHIRLQDVRIGYSFNSKIKALPQLNGEIFLYANNIGILWKANKYNIDPDYVGANFAPSRSIALGVNINL